MKKQDRDVFWVTNVSDRNVSLLDLGLTLRAYSTVNLLDSGHYHLTREQLEASRDSGSIYAKRTKVKVRLVPPKENKPMFALKEELFIPNRAKNAVPVVRPQYEELDISDETFAEENAEMAETDRKPILAKK